MKKTEKSNHHQHSSLFFDIPKSYHRAIFDILRRSLLLSQHYPVDSLGNISLQLQLPSKTSITMQSNIFGASKLALLALFAAQLSTLSLGHPVLEQRSPPIVLGLAASFGAIAHTTLTSTGPTV
jgi:hypothetical protein